MELTPEQRIELEQLKDITLPETISWYPFALGWWVVIALVTILFIYFIILLWRKHTLLRRVALAELATLKKSLNDSREAVTDIAVLLKRIAIKTQGEKVATLSGSDWQQFLREKGMKDNIASYIANAPYQNNIADAPTKSKLFASAKKWIRGNAS